jgi:hypothetical protein
VGKKKLIAFYMHNFLKKLRKGQGLDFEEGAVGGIIFRGGGHSHYVHVLTGPGRGAGGGGGSVSCILNRKGRRRGGL